MPATRQDTDLVVHQVPLDAIDEGALTRDRAALDEAALQELRASIAANGVRMPVELFELAEPEPPFRYGLLSGLRRLTACAPCSRRRARTATARSPPSSAPPARSARR